MPEPAMINARWRKPTHTNGGSVNCVEVGAISWRKSSYSSNGGTACVEVGAIPWRKSSHSDNGGADCVEVGAAPWRKSSYSDSGGSACVEAADASGAILVRDTNDDGTGPVLRLTPANWHAFTARLRAS
jgi:Domain of unknown function (DUF397)